MTAQQLSGTTAIVTGASRGFGRGIAAALTQAGAHVVGVARDAAALDQAREQLGAAFTPVVADAADPVVAGQLIDRYQPRTLVLNAGASPLARPIHRQTWQTFSRWTWLPVRADRGVVGIQLRAGQTLSLDEGCASGRPDRGCVASALARRVWSSRVCSENDVPAAVCARSCGFAVSPAACWGDRDSSAQPLVWPKRVRRPVLAAISPQSGQQDRRHGAGPGRT